VFHHGDGKAVDIVKVEFLEDVTGPHGERWKQGDVMNAAPGETWFLVSETGGSPSSGDTHCYMTYVPTMVQDPAGPARLWDAAGNRFRGRIVERGSAQFSLDRFCGPT